MVVVVGLLLLLAVVKLLEQIFGKKVYLVLVLLTALIGFGLMGRACDGGALRVGTYNVRRFGVEPTDMARLAEVVSNTRADLLALEEVQSEERAEELATRLSVGGRRFAVKLSSCGGKSAMRVGFLYDGSRLTLRDPMEFPELDPAGGGSCSGGERPGFAVTAVRPRGRVRVLAVHLVAGGEPDRVARRKEQWRLIYKIVARLREGDATPVAVLGDTNSTGYLDDAQGERTFIEREASLARMDLLTGGLACSEYWKPGPDGIAPSLLDHVLVTPGLARRRSARVHGFCRELACAPSREIPEEWRRVSDHCPVTFDLE